MALLGALPGLLGADSSYVNGFFLNGLLTAAALGLPLCVDRFRAGESKRGGIWGGLCVIALLGIPTWRYATYDFFRGPPHTLGTLAYGLRTVEAGREVCAISAFPLEDRVADGLEVVGSSRARRLTVYRLRALEDTTLLAVGRRLGLPLFRSAVKFGEAPVRVIAEGPFTCPHPREWLASEAVKSYSFETENGRTRLVLELVPGADTNVAADLLSEIGPIVCERFLVLPAD